MAAPALGDPIFTVSPCETEVVIALPTFMGSGKLRYGARHCWELGRDGRDGAGRSTRCQEAQLGFVGLGHSVWAAANTSGGQKAAGGTPEDSLFALWGFAGVHTTWH